MQMSLTHHHHAANARAESASMLRASAAELLVVALGPAGVLWRAGRWVAS
jgi:hypothetical protein